MKQTIALIISQLIITVGGFALLGNRQLDSKFFDTKIMEKMEDCQTLIIKGFLSMEKDMNHHKDEIYTWFECIHEDAKILNDNLKLMETKENDRIQNLSDSVLRWLAALEENVILVTKNQILQEKTDNERMALTKDWFQTLQNNLLIGR